MAADPSDDYDDPVRGGRRRRRSRRGDVAAPRGRRSTRDRPAKAPLSEEVIVDTALEILRAEGLEAVTMRRVASALDTGPASLYVYIGGRDELRAAMLDRVAAGVPLQAPDPERWREQIQTLLGRMLAAFEAHPGIAQVAVADIPTTEHSIDCLENMLSLLRAGRIDPQDAAWGCDILFLIVTATAVEFAIHQTGGVDGRGQPEVIEDVRATFAGLPVDRYPLISAHAAEMTEGDSEARFQFAIGTFLDGLVARAASAR